VHSSWDKDVGAAADVVIHTHTKLPSYMTTLCPVPCCPHTDAPIVTLMRTRRDLLGEAAVSVITHLVWKA